MGKRILHPNHTAVPRNFCRLPSGYGVIKIGVSGAADTKYAGRDSFEKGKELGREIAKQGAIITSGATTGFPMYAAMGAKDECGFSIGFLWDRTCQAGSTGSPQAGVVGRAVPRGAGLSGARG